MPVGIVVSLLRALQTRRACVVVLARAESTVAVDSLIGRKQPSVALASLAVVVVRKVLVHSIHVAFEKKKRNIRNDRRKIKQ